MWQCGVVLVIFGVVGISCLQLTPNFHPCSKSHDFKHCAKQHGNEILPYLLKGNKEYNVPNLLPLKLPLVEVESGPNLKIKLTDVELYGLDTVTLEDIDVSFNEDMVYLDLKAARLAIIGTYDVNGQIMILPIKGHGPINITAENLRIKYTFFFKLEDRGGAKYGVIQDNDQLEFSVGKAYFKLDNLFDGNQAMGDNVNKFLNENEQDVIKELGGVIDGTVRSIGRRLGGAVISSLPFDELFLE